MEDMARRYADRAVRSVFLYTREAHPGENYRHHATMDDKRHHARAFREHNSIEREILLDDVAGTAHRAYGMLPNMTWIIGRGGGPAQLSRSRLPTRHARCVFRRATL